MRKSDPIEHIKDVLNKHEEPYQLGGWENFQSYRKRKYKMKRLKFFSAIAASFLLIFTLSFWIFDFTDDSTNQIGQNEVEHSDPLKDTTVQRVTPLYELPKEFHTREENDQVRSEVYDLVNNFIKQEDKSQLGEIELTHVTHINESVIYQKQLPDIPNLIKNTEVLLQNMSKNGLHAYSKQGSYVELNERDVMDYSPVIRVENGYSHNQPLIKFGFAYSPLLNMSNSTTDWNFGAGISVEWNLFDHLTLISGINIAQNQLKFRNDQRIAAASGEKFDDSIIEIDLLSLEIPINLQYSLTDRFYLSAGVSSASFLKENYNFTNTYEDMILRIQYVEGKGYIEIEELVTISESVKESEPSLSSFHPAAFYNFSVGYKFEYSERSRFSVEPFVKIPTYTLSSQNITYTTAGLHFKISF